MAEPTADNAATTAPAGAAPPCIHVANNPVAILHSLFAKLQRRERANYDFDSHRDTMRWFLQHLLNDNSHCINMDKGGAVQCQCLSSLGLSAVEQDDVVECMLGFACLGRKNQNQLIVEWIKCGRAARGRSQFNLSYEE